MNKVTVRVPATTANLGPGFDAFGCALSLYSDVTFEESEEGLEITGCDEAYCGPDNLAYTSYCAVLASLSEEVRGVKIHIDAHINHHCLLTYIVAIQHFCPSGCSHKDFRIAAGACQVFGSGVADGNGRIFLHH